MVGFLPRQSHNPSPLIAPICSLARMSSATMSLRTPFVSLKASHLLFARQPFGLCYSDHRILGESVVDCRGMAANKVTAVHGLGFSRPRTTTSRMGENPAALFLLPCNIYTSRRMDRCIPQAGSSAAAGPSGPAVATTLTACRVQASTGLRAFRRLLHALRIGRYLDACPLLLEQHHGA